MSLSQPGVPLDDAIQDEVRRHFWLTPPLDARCAHYLEPIAHPCVYWNFGVTYPSPAEKQTEESAVIYLHKVCAISFARALLMDVERLEGRR